jgi:hypothetical protein
MDAYESVHFSDRLCVDSTYSAQGEPIVCRYLSERFEIYDQIEYKPEGTSIRFYELSGRQEAKYVAVPDKLYTPRERHWLRKTAHPRWILIGIRICGSSRVCGSSFK